MRSLGFIGLVGLCGALSACSGFTVRLPASEPRESASSDEIGKLLRDAASNGTLCERLRDQYLPVPVDGTWAPGTAPAGGRWHVRECAAHAAGSDIAVHLGGEGWTWADRSDNGFRVRQYVGFQASADMHGSLDLAYDEDHKLATVWLTPSSPASVRLTPTGPIRPKAENFATQIVAWIAPGFVQSQAKKTVTQEGTREFQEILGRGVTLTVDVAKNFQMDVTPDLLPKGVRPARPYGQAPAWVVNERQFLAPEGTHVVGPIEPGEYGFESGLESGGGVSAYSICVDDFLAKTFTPRISARFQMTNQGVKGPIASSCRFYLVTEKVGGGAAMVDLHVWKTGR